MNSGEEQQNKTNVRRVEEKKMGWIIIKSEFKYFAIFMTSSRLKFGKDLTITQSKYIGHNGEDISFILKTIVIEIKSILCAGQIKLLTIYTAIQGPLYVTSVHFSLVPTLGTFCKKKKTRVHEYIIVFCGSILQFLQNQSHYSKLKELAATWF